MAITLNERDRQKANRDYFELGCICIQDGIQQKLDPNVTHSNAVAYYEASCRCSRNYTQPDSQPGLTDQ